VFAVGKYKCTQTDTHMLQAELCHCSHIHTIAHTHTDGNRKSPLSFSAANPFHCRAHGYAKYLHSNHISRIKTCIHSKTVFPHARAQRSHK